MFFLVKNSLEFELKSERPDSQVRLIRLEATVQDHKFVFLNISLYSREDKGDREGIPHTYPIPKVIRLELFLESG